MINRRALLAAIVFHVGSVRVGNAEDRLVVDLDPTSKELALLFEEISKWIEADKLLPVSFMLVAQNTDPELEAQLLVKDIYGQCEVFQNPPKVLLLKLEHYFTTFKNTEGNLLRSILLGRKENGEYSAQRIDSLSGTLAIRIQC